METTTVANQNFDDEDDYFTLDFLAEMPDEELHAFSAMIEAAWEKLVSLDATKGSDELEAFGEFVGVVRDLIADVDESGTTETAE